MKIRVDWASWTPVLLAGGTGLVLGFLAGFIAGSDPVSWGLGSLRSAWAWMSLGPLPGLTIAVLGLAAGMIGLASGLRRVHRSVDRLAPALAAGASQQAAPRVSTRSEDLPEVVDYWRNGSDSPSAATQRPQVGSGSSRGEQVPERLPAAVVRPQPDRLDPERPAPEPATPISAARPAELAARDSAKPPSAGDDPSFWAERLLPVWNRYRTTSEGFFTAPGLERVLQAEGVEADVVPAEELSAQDEILGVVPRGANGEVYLLPSFTLPARAVESWFDDHGSGVRTAPVTRLQKVAIAERGAGGLSLRQRGVVA